VSDPALFEKIKGKIKPKAVGQCPDAPGDLAIFVSRRDNQKPVAGAQVKASGPTPGAGQTDAEGWVIFADRKPGAYKTDVKLPASLGKFHLASATQAGAVACADTEILHFQAAPPPALKVKVVSRRPKGDKVIEEALSGIQIEARGPAKHSGSTTQDWSTFNDLDPGTYHVSVKSLGARAHHFVIPESHSATLAYGETKEIVLVATPLASLRVILFDKDDKPIKDASWALDSPVAASGSTGADGLIRVEKIPLARGGAGKLTIRYPKQAAAPRPAPPAAAAANPNAPPPYPPKIEAKEFKDKDPAAPDAGARVVDWKLTLGLQDDYADDAGVKDRLWNLGFNCTRASDPAATTRAVKAYQRFQMKNPNGSGAHADAKGDIKTRHDNP
jgi:hypothetical protein